MKNEKRFFDIRYFFSKPLNQVVQIYQSQKDQFK